MDVTVSTYWLAKKLNDPNLKILDGSWHLPTENRNALEEFSTQHIAGSQFFDIDAISDANTDLTHMLPSEAQFAIAAENLGISNDVTIVIYDTAGLFSSARVWWMFRVMGHEKVYVLDGGLPKWMKDGHAVTSKTTSVDSVKFKASIRRGAIISAEDVNLSSLQIVDARPRDRFLGNSPEPRAVLRKGHIPHARNIFFKDVLTNDSCLKSKIELRALFMKAGVDVENPVITSCGSGITAAVLTLALTLLDTPGLALYDGSWAEWGARENLPIETDYQD